MLQCVIAQKLDHTQTVLLFTLLWTQRRRKPILVLLEENSSIYSFGGGHIGHHSIPDPPTLIPNLLTYTSFDDLIGSILSKGLPHDRILAVLFAHYDDTVGGSGVDVLVESVALDYDKVVPCVA